MKTDIVSFEELCLQYMNKNKRELSKKTLKERQSIINCRLLPFFKDFRLCEITSEMIKAFQSNLLDINYSLRYRIKINSTLSCIIRFAKKNKYLSNEIIMNSICLQSDLNFSQFWSQSELDYFLSSFNDNLEYKTLFSLVFICELYQSEARCLRREDVDLKNKIIHVSRKYVRRKKTHKEEIYNYDERKTVEITDDVFSTLSTYLKSVQSDLLFNVSRYKFTEILSLTCEKLNLSRIIVHSNDNENFLSYIK